MNRLGLQRGILGAVSEGRGKNKTRYNTSLLPAQLSLTPCSASQESQVAALRAELAGAGSHSVGTQRGKGKVKARR